MALGSVTKRLIVQLSAEDKMTPALQKAGKGVSAFESTLGKAAIALTAVNQGMQVAQKAAQVLKKGFDLAAEGAQIQRLEQAGSSLARTFGADMDEVIRSLKKASHNTISETDLMLSANKAMMLGVSANTAELAQLMEIAAVRGHAMGLSTTQAFNDIVTGVGRGSKLILDNLGIIVDGEVNLQNVLEQNIPLIEAMGGVVDDNASAFERFGAAAEDAGNRLKVAFAEAIAPTVGGLADMITHSNDLASAYELLEFYGTDVDAMMNEMFIAGKMNAGEMNEELLRVAREFVRVHEAQQQLAESDLGFRTGSLEGTIDTVNRGREAIQRLYGEVMSHPETLLRTINFSILISSGLTTQTTGGSEPVWAGQQSGLESALTGKTVGGSSYSWNRAYGGDLRASGITKVGERGYEYIVGGTVLSHEQSRGLDRMVTGYQRRGYGGAWGDVDLTGWGGIVKDSGLPTLAPGPRDAYDFYDLPDLGTGKQQLMAPSMGYTMASPLQQAQMASLQNQSAATASSISQNTQSGRDQVILLTAMQDRMEQLLSTQDMRDMQAMG